MILDIYYNRQQKGKSHCPDMEDGDRERRLAKMYVTQVAGCFVVCERRGLASWALWNTGHAINRWREKKTFSRMDHSNCARSNSKMLMVTHWGALEQPNMIEIYAYTIKIAIMQWLHLVSIFWFSQSKWKTISFPRMKYTKIQKITRTTHIHGKAQICVVLGVLLLQYLMRGCVCQIGDL